MQGAPTGDSNDVFGIDPAGEPIRISRRGVHIICAVLDGPVRWRAVVDQPLGPLAAGTPGTVGLPRQVARVVSKTTSPPQYRLAVSVFASRMHRIDPSLLRLAISHSHLTSSIHSFGLHPACPT